MLGSHCHFYSEASAARDHVYFYFMSLHSCYFVVFRGTGHTRLVHLMNYCWILGAIDYGLRGIFVVFYEEKNFQGFSV